MLVRTSSVFQTDAEMQGTGERRTINVCRIPEFPLIKIFLIGVEHILDTCTQIHSAGTQNIETIRELNSKVPKRRRPDSHIDVRTATLHMLHKHWPGISA